MSCAIRDVAKPSGGEEDCLQIYRIPDPANWNYTSGSSNDIVYKGATNFHSTRNFGLICEWDNVLSSFGSEISEWAKDSVYFMAANKIINGVGGNKFAPQNTTIEEEVAGYANATREQALKP